MQVNIINRSKHPLPQYETEFAAGMDLRANIEAPIVIQPLERLLVPTGLFMQLQPGTEAQIRPRSGLAFKQGLTVLNSPGTIDADYRGEIKVLLVNLGNTAATVEDGQRIAQMVIAPYHKIQWQQVEELNTSARGEGGYGHTGNK